MFESSWMECIPGIPRNVAAAGGIRQAGASKVAETQEMDIDSCGTCLEVIDWKDQ